MAVRKMVWESERIKAYKNGAPLPENVEACTNPYGSSLNGQEETIYMETAYVGLVLRVWERNGYDDSDFFATVWNPEKGEPEQVMYATTRGWTYLNGATVDATPEVMEAWKKWSEAKRAEREKAEAEVEAKTPRRGKKVRVVKGRKVPKGLEGEVFWEGKDKFSGGLRIGIKVGVESYFLAASNVEVMS